MAAAAAPLAHVMRAADCQILLLHTHCPAMTGVKSACRSLRKTRIGMVDVLIDSLVKVTVWLQRPRRRLSQIIVCVGMLQSEK